MRQARPARTCARSIKQYYFHLTRIIFDRPGKIRPCAAQPLRVVRVATDKRHPDGTPVEMGLVTNRLDLAADLIAVAYRYR